MSGHHHFKATLTALLTAWLFISTHCGAQTISRMSSRFLARGEQALLEIAIAGETPQSVPVIPAVPGVEIRSFGGARPRQSPGQRMEFVFPFLVSSYEIGPHVLPSIEVITAKSKTRTEPLEFTVFNPDEVQWAEAVVGGIPFRYASAFRIMNPRPFEGETTPVEIKIFVPRDLFVEDWGIPDFERDGVTAWRFQPSIMKGEVNLLGMPHISVAYPSTLTPTRAGKVGIGPATVRLMTTQVVMDGFMRRVAQEVNLTVPKLEIETTPLPPGAPQGFENAVGSFSLESSTAQTEVQEGDPIQIKVVVRGSGNLDTLRPPKPVDADGWKVYEASAEQRGDERRELSGHTVFHQFMRPLELKSAIPAFRLVYFEPRSKTYKTLTTEPIALQMKPALAPRPDSLTVPPALSVPVERMTDILGVLRPASLTVSGEKRLPWWLGHTVAALIALGLLAKAFWMRNAHRFRRDPVRDERIKALREIESMKKGDDAGFLMSAGAFIERWLGGNPAPEIREVLAERDAVCFRPERQDKPLLDPKRRDAILRTLRKAAMVVLLGGMLGLGQSRGEDVAKLAQEAYDSARYDEAIAHWLKAGNYDDLSADTLYNIGNACYRAGSPGHAALYYRRAMARDPGHQEARQNLRFIERKYGSITVHRPEYQYALARLSLPTWQGMLWAGGWISLLSILVFPATRSGSRLRIAGITGLVVGPLLAASGGLGWRYYPNDSEFAAVERQAVIIGDKAVLHADAARTSPEVIDAPPGSICEVISESGRWAYVAFATKTRGWIPMESIEKVVPDKAPEAPKIRKPKADGKSA